MWLACADDGAIVDTTPYQLDVPAGLERGLQLVGLLDECTRVLEKLSPGAVAILNPESTARITSFGSVRARVTGEVMLSLAAAKLGLPCRYISRPTVRSVLKLGTRGRLSDVVTNATGVQLRPHWKGERDLAALTALALREDADAAR